MQSGRIVSSAFLLTSVFNPMRAANSEYDYSVMKSLYLLVENVTYCHFLLCGCHPSVYLARPKVASVHDKPHRRLDPYAGQRD